MADSADGGPPGPESKAFRIGMGASVFLLGYAFGSCVLTFCILVALVTGAAAIFYADAARKEPRGSTGRVLVGGCLAGLLVRFLVLVVCWTLVSNFQPVYRIMVRQWNNEVLLMLTLGDGGFFEAQTRMKVNGVRTGRAEMDPFPGQPFREKDGVRYSVGPDYVDDGMAVEYDPTNGTISAGDIPTRSQ